MPYKTAPKKDLRKLQPFGLIKDDLTAQPVFQSIFRQNVTLRETQIALLNPSQSYTDQREWVEVPEVTREEPKHLRISDPSRAETPRSDAE